MQPGPDVAAARRCWARARAGRRAPRSSAIARRRMRGGRAVTAIGVARRDRVLAAFPIAGVPLAWVSHLRVAVTANGDRPGAVGAARILRAVPRDQPVGPDRDRARRRRCCCSTPRCCWRSRRARSATSAAPAPRCRWSRSRSCPSTLVQPQPPVPPGPAAVRAAGGVHVGRAGADGRRGAACCSRCAATGAVGLVAGARRSTQHRRGSTTEALRAASRPRTSSASTGRSATGR